MEKGDIMFSRFLLMVFVFILFSPGAPQCAEKRLQIANETRQDILNILARPQTGENFFIRLDLAPGASAAVENPEITASLRVDTGLEFWSFKDVDFSLATSITFRKADTVELVLQTSAGDALAIGGEAKSLVPGKGDRLVCDLEKFHPLMPMRDVCEILAPDTPVDDNGAMLAGLGFGGLVWAARLAPAQNGPINENSRLEHLELRRPLSHGDADKIISGLYRQGYVPWQAEFPGKDIDFATGARDQERSKALLSEEINSFMAQKDTRPKTNPQDKEPQATIMLAPASIVGALANADAPTTDVQLFTLILKPATDTFIVDVSAYAGNE